jgi:hypothetical protein
MSKAAKLPGWHRTAELPTPTELTHRSVSAETTAVTVSAELTHRSRAAETTAVTVSAELTLRTCPVGADETSFRSFAFTVTSTALPTSTFHNPPKAFECFPAQRTLLRPAA